MVTPQQDLEMRVLEFVYDHDDGSSDRPAAVGDLADEFGYSIALETGHELRERGLVTLSQRYSGGYQMTPTGKHEVEAMRARRTDQRRRRAECRAALLRWLDDRSAINARTKAAREDFSGHVDLLPFTGAESEAAAVYLAGRALVDGISAMQGEYILLWLTGEGQDCADSGKSIEEFLAHDRPGASHQTITVSGSNNTIAGALGADATASVAVESTDQQTVDLLLRAITELRASLNLPSNAGDVLDDVAEADTPSLQQRALGRLYLMLSDTTTGASGALLAAYMAHAFGIHLEG